MHFGCIITRLKVTDPLINTGGRRRDIDGSAIRKVNMVSRRVVKHHSRPGQRGARAERQPSSLDEIDAGIHGDSETFIYGEVRVDAWIDGSRCGDRLLA